MRWLVHVATAAFVAVASPASATFYTYAEWTGLPEGGRAAYVAGLFDGLVTFIAHVEDQPMALHFNECIKNARMTNGQLGENVRVYASTRPNLQGQPVGAALIAYLHQLYGKPPGG
jgi:hypothetical protein